MGYSPWGHKELGTSEQLTPRRSVSEFLGPPARAELLKKQQEVVSSKKMQRARRYWCLCVCPHLGFTLQGDPEVQRNDVISLLFLNEEPLPIPFLH